MKKSDLKDGMVVEYRNGNLGIKVGKHFYGLGGGIYYLNYNENLIDGSGISGLDIIAVYERNTRITDIYEILKKENLKLIWERKFDIDWSKIPVDTKILVSDYGGEWIKRYFAKYENGKVSAWNNGKASFTTDRSREWDCAKLYEENMEG